MKEGKKIDAMVLPTNFDDRTTIVRYITRPGASNATPHVDLWRFIIHSLVDKGVPINQITKSGIDSMTCDACFSYRREQGRTGRMALFAMLQDEN